MSRVCDNDRLSPHSDVEPEPALILIHYLYFPQLADCANRIQHMHSRHAALKGDGACGVVSFTGQCLTHTTAQNEPIFFNLHWVLLHFNGCDKSYSILQVSPKTLSIAVWYFFPKISRKSLSLKATDDTNVENYERLTETVNSLINLSSNRKGNHSTV